MVSHRATESCGSAIGAHLSLLPATATSEGVRQAEPEDAGKHDREAAGDKGCHGVICFCQPPTIRPARSARASPQHAQFRQIVISPFQPGCRITVLYGKVLRSRDEEDAKAGQQDDQAPHLKRAERYRKLFEARLEAAVQLEAPNQHLHAERQHPKAHRALFWLFPIHPFPSKFTKGWGKKSAGRWGVF